MKHLIFPRVKNGIVSHKKESKKKPFLSAMLNFLE